MPDSMDLFFNPDTLIIIFALFLLGIGGGIIAGLLGIGGGAIFVPALFYFFTTLGVEQAIIMHLCIGTSLLIVFLTGISSAWSHWRRGAVDFSLVRAIGGGIVLGVIAGSVIAKYVDGQSLGLFFVVMAVILTGVMFVDVSRFGLSDKKPGAATDTMAGTVMGALATLMGIGGGVMSVPYLTLFGQTIHRAIGTSAALGVVIAFCAAIGFMVIGAQTAIPLPAFAIGFVHIPAATFLASGSILGAPVGAMMAHNLPVKILKRIFACFLVLVVIKMGYELL